MRCDSWLPPSRRRCRALDRPDDAGMRPAAAEVVRQRAPDVALARLLVLGEEGGRLHDHAVDAVAALGGLLVDEGLLHAMQLLAAGEALERHDLLLPFDRGQRSLARAHGLAGGKKLHRV